MSVDAAAAPAQPPAAERIGHGMPLFHVERGRGVAWWLPDHHGCGIHAIAVEARGADERAMLVEADPALYYRPAYLGAAGWVGTRVATGAVDRDRVRARIEASRGHAATPRQRERHGR